MLLQFTRAGEAIIVFDRIYGNNGIQYLVFLLGDFVLSLQLLCLQQGEEDSGFKQNPPTNGFYVNPASFFLSLLHSAVSREDLGLRFCVIIQVVEHCAADGKELQAALVEWTDQRTVPNVFIGGNHIGGCDCKIQIFYRSLQDSNHQVSSHKVLNCLCFYAATTALHTQGKLVPLLISAGAVAKSTA